MRLGSGHDEVKVPVLIKDPEVSRYKDLPLVEDFIVEQEELFLDGPVSRRLAILDFDADAGGLRAGRALRARPVPGPRVRPLRRGLALGAGRGRLHPGQHLRRRAQDALPLRGARHAGAGGALGVRRLSAAGGAARRGVGQRVLRARDAQPAALLRQAGQSAHHLRLPLHGHPRPRDRPRRPGRHRARPLRLAAAGVAGPARGGGRSHHAAHGLLAAGSWPSTVLAQTGGSITHAQRLHRDRRAVRRRHPSGPGGPAQSLQRPHHEERGHERAARAERGAVGGALPRHGADSRAS